MTAIQSNVIFYMIPDIELVGLNIAGARGEARTQAVWKESKNWDHRERSGN